MIFWATSFLRLFFFFPFSPYHFSYFGLPQFPSIFAHHLCGTFALRPLACTQLTGLWGQTRIFHEWRGLETTGAVWNLWNFETKLRIFNELVLISPSFKYPRLMSSSRLLHYFATLGEQPPIFLFYFLNALSHQWTLLLLPCFGFVPVDEGMGSAIVLRARWEPQEVWGCAGPLLQIWALIGGGGLFCGPDKGGGMDFKQRERGRWRVVAMWGGGWLVVKKWSFPQRDGLGEDKEGAKPQDAGLP